MLQRIAIGLLALLGAATLPGGAAAQGCGDVPVALQILGSGGPTINRERASTSYLLWLDGKGRILIDAGGGAFHRYGESQARLSDLTLVALSHFHPDHVSDLPALLWLSAYQRQAPLPIVGPTGNDIVPDLPTFLARLFDARTGAFQVLGTTLGGAPMPQVGGGVRLDVRPAVDVARPEPTRVLDADGVIVTALGIPHGNIPALAYRIETRGASLVLSSDQNGTDPRFVDFARGASVLVMHLAIAAGATNPLHAAPALVGRLAREAGVGHLVVSHIGVFDLAAAIAELKTAYPGRLTVGADLQCTPVP